MGVLTRKLLGLLAGLLMMILLLPCVIAPAPAWAESVSYLDENGTTQTQEINAVIKASTEMTSYGDADSDTWLLARGNFGRARLVFNGNVNLVLEDNCKLTVNGGILIKENFTLSIYAQSTGSKMGSLVAYGGGGGNVTISAGIGANAGNNAGNIAIYGGDITASRGNRDASCIGAYKEKSCQDITIAGGRVKTTGSGQQNYSNFCIGTISNGSCGDITIKNGAFVQAGKISNKAKADEWNGIVIESNSGTVYGTNVAPSSDITIESGKALTISAGQTLTINNGIVLNIESGGTIVNNGVIRVMQGGSFNVNGTLSGSNSHAVILDVGDDVDLGNTPQRSYGEAVKLPETGIRTGYTACWFETADFVYSIVTEAPAATDSDKLYRILEWRINQYTISFDSDGGSNVSPIIQDYDTEVTPPANPTRTGYTFTGWDKAIPVRMPADNLTIKAKWKINQYTISFDAAGGTEVASIKQDYGTEVAAPVAPTRAGYTFSGWSEDIPATMPAGDIKLTAKWTPNTDTAYKVEHWRQNTARDGYDKIETDSLTGTTDTTATAAGKAYKGFALNSSASGSKASGNIAGDGSLTLRLYYDRNVYGVTLNANGGTINNGDVKEYAYGVGATLPYNVTKAGYTFEGWYDNENFEGNIVGSVAKDETGNKVFYAKWTPNSYTVQFKCGEGAKGSMSSQLFTYDQAQALTPNTFTREGYSFAGWQDSAGNKYTNAKEVKNLTVLAGATVTLTAQWEANPSVISFVTNCEIDVDQIRGKTDDPITDRAMPSVSRTGYTFEGWYYKESYGAIKVAQLPDKHPVGDITYYAMWQVNKYKITYELNGGTEGAAAPKEHVYDTATTLVDPVRRGYTFKGWYSDKAMTTKPLSIIPAASFTSDIKLYAKWEPNKYKITYELNGGTKGEGSPEEHVYDTVTKLVDPVLEGYTFKGWYLDDTMSMVLTNAIPATLITTDITLHAKWAINQYTISFNSAGGIEVASITQDYGTEVTAPVAPTRAGYTFAAWDKDVPATMPAKDVTLTAQWTADPSVISFESNGGSSVAAMTGVTDEDISDRTLPAPTRHSHSFLGWYDNKGLKGEPVKQLPKVFPVGGTTYYAKWQYYCIHTPEDMAAVAPTCTEPGLTEGSKCSACGQILKAQEQLPVLGHEWGDWVVTKKASVLEEGVETATCTHEGCQATQTRAIDKLDTTAIKSKGISYSFDGKTVVVTGVEKGKTKVTIPATVKIDGVSYAVTEIAPYAFKNCKKLTKFVVGDNIFKIGKGAFQGCKKLKSMTIGKNVKSIGKVAFKGCKNLTSITVTSKHLTKKQVKNCLKGSKVKTVIVKVGSVKANKTYAKKYAKVFTKKTCGKKVKVMASKKALK